MVDTIKWGILSTGSIADSFARGLQTLDDAEILAVGSRRQTTADEFANRHDIPRRYASYEDLAADPDIDIIYIATPHVFHAENMHLCLDHDKHILCEKPFTINAKQALQVIQRAREAQRFCMEAVWMRFLPAIVRLREWIAAGRIGEVTSIQADFSVKLPYDPDGRIYNPALGGGALLDVGIYPISFVMMILGMPDDIQSHVHMSDTGVDDQGGLLFTYPQGKFALISFGVRGDGNHAATVQGTEGYIHVHAPFHNSQQLTLHRHDADDPQTERLPYESTGLNYEAGAVHASLMNNKLENDIMPLDETLQTMQVMDRIREQWGFSYPMESD